MATAWRQQPAITDMAGLLGLFAPIATLQHEEACFALFDAAWRLVDVMTLSGTASHVALPVRDVARRALMANAACVAAAHNHPGGDPMPSADDISATRRLARALDAIGVRLSDHLILAGPRHASFAALGLL